MIIKERKSFILFAASIVVGVYLFTYIATPGYIVPFLNNPIWRIIVVAWSTLFFVHSVLLLFVPKPRTGWAKVSIAFYFFISTIPNVFLPIFGPAFVTIGGCSF